MKRSESDTENIFREFYGARTFIEKASIPSSYGFKSKRGTAYRGLPDFLYEGEHFVIVVEAKAMKIDDATREVQYYMTNNAIAKDIIGLAISGTTKSTFVVKYFIRVGSSSVERIESCGKLMTIENIEKIYRRKKYGQLTSTESLVKTLKALNKRFHEDMKIKDTERSLFFAGLMIALKDNTFLQTYSLVEPPTKEQQKAASFKLHKSHNLNEVIIKAIDNQISNKTNNHSKEYNWRDRFSFIRNIDYPIDRYKEIIKLVETKIFYPFSMDEKQDILGRAYKIFLSRAGAIENKNIILTPDHIKSLMVELARVGANDVVLDTCTGSGGFLMEAMELMIKDAKNDERKIKEIKERHLIGFEIDATLFALACSNMFLHGDGRTNLIFRDSLLGDDSESRNVLRYIRKLHPTACVINPPYERNYPIQFVKQALEYLTENGRLVIIMPTPTLNRNIGGLTDEILRMARLDFVIKMPENLFSEQKRSVNTSIFGFTKTPHRATDEVVFYNMKDDGFVSVQHKGKVDKYGKWEAIRRDVLLSVARSRKSSGKEEIKTIVDANGVINCYGWLKDSTMRNAIPFGELFSIEKGSLASEDAEPGRFDFVTASEEWKTHSSYEYDKEALVYAVAASGSRGRCHYVNGKFIASNLCLVLTPKQPDKYPVSLRFYNYYLNKIRERISDSLSDGTSKLVIGIDDLREFPIEYFPIDVQNEVADKHYRKLSMLEKKVLAAKRELDLDIERLIRA